MDVDTEKLDAELSKLAERRAKEAKKDEKQRVIEEEWERRLRAKRRTRQERIRQEWIGHHLRMHQLHTSLAAEHADKRSRLMLEGGYDPDQGPGEEVG